MSKSSGRTYDIRQPEHLPQSKTLSGSKNSALTYQLRGRFASARTFVVSHDAIHHRADKPVPQIWPRWYSSAAFALTGMATIFMMCAIGRPGA
ncbi:hypothetical protein [Sphingobium yanoikuyae]